MKTFKDLIFGPHPNGMGAIYARLNFSNGYGVSVVSGGFSCSNAYNSYELAVLKGNKLCFDTPITHDVLGYLTRSEVTDIMKRVQQLGKKQKELPSTFKIEDIAIVKPLR